MNHTKKGYKTYGMAKWAALSLVFVLSFGVLTGCVLQVEEKETIVTIGLQQGVGSASLLVMSEKGFLNDFLPEGYTVSFKTISGGGVSVREALSVGAIDFGAMGVPPIVIAVDNDLGIKVVCGIASSNIGFITRDNSIQSIEDIGDKKIAILQKASIQHVTLCMIADRLFGDPTLFDDNLIVLAESEAYVAMDAQKEVSSYFGLNPTKSRVAALDGSREIFSSQDYGIKISSLMMCVNASYNEANPEITEAIASAIEYTFDWMQNNRDEVVSILKGKLSMGEDLLNHVLDDEIFNTEVFGYDDCAEYMHHLRMIENEPVVFKDVSAR